MRHPIEVQVHDNVHIKGVGKSWGRSGDFWQWMSLLGEGTAEETIYLIVGLSSVLRFDLSLKVALKVINWSLRALYKGEWPTEDWNDEPLNDPKATPL